MTESISKDRPLFLDIGITNISKNDKDERRVVAGYASFDVIDRQGEKITHEAMKKALDKFMASPEFANVHVLHGNVAVGKVIESYTDMNGVVWETKVDDTGTFIVSELRAKGELKRADQTWELITAERLKSYSIGGLVLSPKEIVCDDGSCHSVINDIEIHEFSYVDRPAVKGADFVIIKSEDGISWDLKNNHPGIKAMTCPLDAKEDTQRASIGSESRNLNKQGVLSADEIIMTDTPAEEISEPIPVPEPKPELATSPDLEAEKADATPLLLKLIAMVEKLTNDFEHRSAKPAEPEPKKFDYPAEQVEALNLRFGEQRATILLETIGECAFALNSAAEEEPAKVEEPQKEPEAAPEKTEVVAETADEVVAEELVVEVTEKIIKEKVEKQVESTLAEYAEVKKRTQVAPAEIKSGHSLEEIFLMGWQDVEALAKQEGA